MADIKVHNGFDNFYKYLSLLSELVRKNVKIKYRRSVLGILWSLLDPLLSMIVLTIVFSALFRRIPNYPVYYLSGMLAFRLFTGGSTAAMRSMVSSSGIWRSIYVPKYLYVISSVLSNFVTYLISLVILFGLMFVLGVPFTVYIIFASLPILGVIIMTIGAGLIMATLNIFFRDMQHLYSVFCLMLQYAIPLFYPAEIIPDKFQFILTINPLYHLITALRDCFLYGQMYNLPSFLYGFGFSVALLIIGLVVFNRYQDKFILYV